MGLLDTIRGSKKRGVSPNAAFRITQEGRDKLQECSGDTKSQVLMTLETRGTSNVEEICQASGLSRGQVESSMLALAKGGYIQPVGAGMAGDTED